MRLEPEERRNYVLSQLDDYGRCYMTCLEMFVYRLWSRQRVLLKNCKLYEEKLVTISEVIGTLTGRDSVLDNNNAESTKLEKSLRDIHSIVFIPPIKTNDLALINKILVKEEEESLDFMSLALSPSGSQLLSPIGGISSREQSSNLSRHTVIKSQSSSPSPSSNASTKNNTANSNGGHVSVISSSVSSRSVGRPPRATNECLDSASAIAAVTAAINNNHIENTSSSSSSSPTTISNQQQQQSNQSNKNNDRTVNGNGIAVIKKESDTVYTPSNRRTSSGKRSNSGSISGSVTKKPRNARSKDDNELVKCCSQEGCEYIERDNANNMRKHYRNWHNDIDYPNNPYKKREMTTETVNQYLHNWMVQRKKKQPRGPRNDSNSNSNSRGAPEGWPAGITIDGMLVYADESDTGHEDEDYEINEHLLSTYVKTPPNKPIEISGKRV